MSYMRFNYRSDALSRYIDISVVYPTDNYSYLDNGTRDSNPLRSAERAPYRQGMKFQTIYLLHGGGDDDSVVYRYTNAERYAQQNNVMLVTPDVANSFGADTNYGVNYATFLTEELPRVIQAMFASSPMREDNFIVGFAMGGNIALACALSHPQNYAVCVDISGGIGYTLDLNTWKGELNGSHFRTHFCLYNHTFGKAADLEASRHNLRRIAQETLESGIQPPMFYLAAGSEEGFIRDRVFGDAAALKEIGYEVSYDCVEGYRHDFTFWDYYLELVMAKILPLSRDPFGR